MPSADLRALLLACKDDPFDDAPRLVLADWLEEHGEAVRAEFVRLQLRLAALAWYEPEVPELEARQAELLRAHADEWLAEPRSLGLPGCCFHRGMVVTQGTPADFRPLLNPGPAARDGLAWVDTLAVRPPEHLRLGQPTADWENLLASPLAGEFPRLLLHIPQLHGPIQALARSPHLSGVRDLALVGGTSGAPAGTVAELARGSLAGLRRLHVILNTVHGPELAALLKPPHFPHLEWLSLGFAGGAGERTAAALAEPRPTALRSLKLRSYSMYGRHLSEMLAAPHFAGVADLDLLWSRDVRAAGKALSRTAHITGARRLRVSTELGLEEMRGLASAPLLAGVRELVLTLNRFGAAEMEALLKSPHLNGLEVLELHANRLGDDGAAILAQSPALARLRVLVVSGNGIGPRGAEALARSPHLAGLQVLNLRGNPLGPEGCAAVAASPHWRDLRVLNLGDTGPQTDGMKALAASPILREIRRLNLADNRLSGGHLKALLRSRHLGPLAELDLSRNRIDVRAARVLADSPALAGLRVLNLTSNPLDEAAARLLAESPHLNRLAFARRDYAPTDDPPLPILAARFGRDVTPLVFDEWFYRRES